VLILYFVCYRQSQVKQDKFEFKRTNLYANNTFHENNIKQFISYLDKVLTKIQQRRPEYKGIQTVISGLEEYFKYWRNNMYKGDNFTSCENVVLFQIVFNDKVIMSVLSFSFTFDDNEYDEDKIRMQENRFIFSDPDYWVNKKKYPYMKDMALRLHSYTYDMLSPSILFCNPLVLMKEKFQKVQSAFKDVTIVFDKCEEYDKLHKKFISMKTTRVLGSTCLPTIPNITHNWLGKPTVYIIPKTEGTDDSEKDKSEFKTYWKKGLDSS